MTRHEGAICYQPELSETGTPYMAARSSPPAHARRSVRRVPPTSPTARDEGARLIPLDPHPDYLAFSKINYYLSLADKLLKNKPLR